MDAWNNYPRRLTMRHWVPLLLFAIIYLGASLFSGIIPFGGLVVMFVAPGFFAGACGSVIEAERRGQVATLDLMFEPFKTTRFLEMFLIYLLTQLVVLIPVLMLLGGIGVLIFAGGNTGSAWLWVLGGGLILLGLILASLLQIRLSLALPLSAEKIKTESFNPFEPLNKSWAMTKGHMLPLVGIWLVVMLIGIVSMLVLCIGYLFIGTQMIVTTMVASYLLLLPPSQRGGRFADVTTCPWCGYSLEGTEGPLCPECGIEHPARLPGAGVCNRCGYDLSGLPDDRCPECGRKGPGEKPTHSG